jgi:hypothetical protein
VEKQAVESFWKIGEKNFFHTDCGEVLNFHTAPVEKKSLGL